MAKAKKRPSKRAAASVLTATDDTQERPAKLQRTAQATAPSHAALDVIDVDAYTDGEEELRLILDQIRAQEESELVAKSLQKEWYEGPVAGPSTARGPEAGGGIYNGCLVSSLNEDEAMARRLAEEWAAEGNTTVPEGSLNRIGNSTKSAGKAPGAGPSNVNLQNESEQAPSPDVDLARCRDLFTATRNCSKCGKAVKSPRGYVVFSVSTPPPSVLRLLHAYCSSCKTNHCRGCFKAVNCRPHCKGNAKKTECAVENCCAEVRAIGLFEALGGLDRIYLNESSASVSRSNTKKALQPSVKSVVPGGTGYGMGHIVGYNMAPPNIYDIASGAVTSSSHATIPAHHRTISSSDPGEWDGVVTGCLKTLVALLPDPNADSPTDYDLVPHTSLNALLSLSYIPEVLSSLLRNDSVMDWTNRSDTYNAVLLLLRRLADCELTIELLISPRWNKKRSCGLEKWMWREGNIDWEVIKSDSAESRIERDSPLYENFTKLTRQSEIFISGAAQLMDDGQEDLEMTVSATSLCGDIISTRDDVERAISILRTRAVISNHDNKGKGSPAVNVESFYSQECERLAFAYIALQDSDGVYRFHYAKNIQDTASATRNPKDRLHMVKELAVTATSLPPGVWARVDEVRNDAIKVMIAGPENTPYEGGLFEFDCFLPLEYPHKPPLMNLCTTGGGTVRFNPNLYNNGKVCLSLLGTWAGRPEEQWSSKSTLLQVLVSIQSMILVDAPYLNEPAYGLANPDNPESKSYNRNITINTCRWAIVDWLKDSNRTGIWADVIKSHFIIRKNKIRNKIVEWSKAEPKILNFDGRNLLLDFDSRMLVAEAWD